MGVLHTTPNSLGPGCIRATSKLDAWVRGCSEPIASDIAHSGVIGDLSLISMDELMGTRVRWKALKGVQSCHGGLEGRSRSSITTIVLVTHARTCGGGEERARGRARSSVAAWD